MSYLDYSPRPMLLNHCCKLLATHISCVFAVLNTPLSSCQQMTLSLPMNHIRFDYVYCDRIVFTIIPAWTDPTPPQHTKPVDTMLHTAWARNHHPKAAELHLVSCFVTEIFYQSETHLSEWTKLSEGDLNKCISTVVNLHSVDLKPLQTLFHPKYPGL